MSVRSPIARPAIQSWLTARLREVSRTGRGQLIAMRGRRQAGKSTSVEQFVNETGLPSAFVTGVYRMPEREQLAAAAEALASSPRPLHADEDTGSTGAPSSWREFFQEVALAASSGPVIVVLDEFPWIAAGDDAGLEGVLQVSWDRTLEKLPVLMILIGSDITMMSRLSHYDRPLYGRVREIVVPPLDPGEVATGLPGRSSFEIFDAYLATGGYPRLVTELRDRSIATRDWVREALLDDFSPLVTTGQLAMRAEFPDSDVSYRILSAIGASEPGLLNLGAIVQAVADPEAKHKTVQTYVVRALEDLTGPKRLIARDTPAWSTTTRLRRYRLTDPYLRFWFRYVDKHIDTISRGRGDLAAAAFERDWSSWRGRSIEPIVRDALTRLGASDERLTGVEDVRAWWTRDGKVEVDVVTMSQERTTTLGAVKWRKTGGIEAREISALSQLRATVPRASEAMLGAVVPTGIAPATADVVFSSDDLLAAWA